MKKTVFASATALILSIGVGQVWAAGCLKGAAVGAATVAEYRPLLRIHRFHRWFS